MQARPLLLAAAVLAAPALARADLPCGDWVEQAGSLELHGPRGHLILRGAPETLAALRRTLLVRCSADAEGARPPLDIGPVEVDAVLQPPPEAAGGVVELRLQLRAQRLLMEIR